MTPADERPHADDLDDDGDPARDLLIDRLVGAWLRLAREGVAPPIPAYAAAHPDLERELTEYLTGAALLEGLGDRLADAARLGAATSGRGERLGDFLLLGVLGRGGMGVVYDALDEKLGRPVALKVLPESRLGDRRSRERFQREAQAAARLHHRCIVPVHGVGEADGQHWFAMQRIDGVGLDLVVRALAKDGEVGGLDASQDLLARELAARFVGSHVSASDVSADTSAGSSAQSALHAPRWANVARVGRDAAEALAHAHASGVQHRDVKPSNIMLDRRGRVWVADFGLCKSTEHGSVTAAGDVVGTLRYMPPERFRGIELPAGDLYGLGLVLYELITGRPAFGDAGRAELVRQVTYEEPVRPSRLAPDVPRDLERIVVKAMAKLPEERYPSAEALARDLAAFLEGRPVSARPVGAFYLARLFVRRNRALVSLGAAALALLVVATGLYVVGLERLVGELRDSRAATDVEATRARLAASTSALDAGRFVLARRFLDDIPAAERDWVSAHLAHRARSGGLVFGGGGAPVRRLIDLGAEGPGRALAVVRDDALVVHATVDGAELARLDVRGAESVQALDGGARLGFLAPDGGVVRSWDWRRSREASPEEALGAGIVAWAVDGGPAAEARAAGARAVVVRAGGALEVVVVATGERLAAHTIAPAERTLAVASEGHALVAAVGGGAYAVDLGTGALTALEVTAADVQGPVDLAGDLGVLGLRGNRVVSLQPSVPGELTERATGMRLSVVGVDGARGRVLLGNQVGNVFDARRGRGRTELLGQMHSSGITALETLGSGALLATGSEGGEVRVGDANLATDGQAGVGSSRIHTAAVGALAVSRDGAHLVSGDEAGGLVLWDLARQRPIASSAELAPAARGLDLDDAAERAVVAGEWTRLWHVAEGRVEVLPIGATLAARFEGDGLLVVRPDGTVEGLTSAPFESRARVAVPAEHAGERWTSVAVSDEGASGAALLALGSERGLVLVRSAPNRAALAEARDWLALEPLAGGVRDLAFDDSGSRLAVVDAAGWLSTWDVAPGAGAAPPTATRRITLVATEPGMRRNTVDVVAFGRGQRWIVTGAASGGLMTWWHTTGAPGAQLLDVWPRLTALAVPPVGAPLIAADEFGRVSVFQVAPAPPAEGPDSAAAPAELALDDAEGLVRELERAVAPGAAPELAAPARALAEGLRRRLRFGRLELERPARQALERAAVALGLPATEGER